MITLIVKLNGKRMCTAGASDLGVLSAHVTAAGKLGKKTAPFRPNEDDFHVHYSVGGLTNRGDDSKDVHLRWKSSAPLKVGDNIEVQVVESDTADRPKSRKKAVRKRA